MNELLERAVAKLEALEAAWTKARDEDGDWMIWGEMLDRIRDADEAVWWAQAF